MSRKKKGNETLVLCGNIVLSILDSEYGTPRHSFADLYAVAIGTRRIYEKKQRSQKSEKSEKNEKKKEKSKSRKSEQVDDERVGEGEGKVVVAGKVVGEVVEEDQIDFVAEFPSFHRYSKNFLELDQNISGVMSIATKSHKDCGGASEIKNVFTFLPLEPQHLKQALFSKKELIHGQLLIHYTHHLNDEKELIAVTYEFQHVGSLHYLKKLQFSVPIRKMREMKEIIVSLDSAHLLQL